MNFFSSPQRLFGWLLLPTIFLFCVALQAAESVTKITLPSGITCERIGSYSADRLNQVLTKEVPAQLSDYPVTYSPASHAVTLYRITYRSMIPELGNRSTVASGLLALPEATLMNLSIEKAERLLGWKPKWAFEETIKQTVIWYDQVHRKAVTSLDITRSQIAEHQRDLP